MAGPLPSDTVKNLKLNINTTSSVLSIRSYPTIDPQCSSHPSTSINVVKTCSKKEASHSHTSLLQTGMGIGTEQTEEPESTLEDEFQDLHLNLPVLEVLAHTLIYNAMLDKYVDSLELGKNSDFGSVLKYIPAYLFKKLKTLRLLEKGTAISSGWPTKPNLTPIGIVKDVEVHIGKLTLLNDFYAIDMSRARVRKIKGKTYNLSHRGLVYEVILRKKITRKEDIRGNFKIPCNIGDLKHMNALVDQGSDVNVMPLSTYMKLTDERPAETDIRLSLASHSYIYPLGIAEDVLVEASEHVYSMDFAILDIKEDENRPFILETPFLTTTKAVIKFDKGTINLRSGKSKISFHRILESLCKIEREVKNDIEPIAPTMAINRLVLEWEKRIKHHLEREMKIDQWKSKNFKGKHPALVKIKGGMDDEGEVTLYLTRRSLEDLRMFSLEDSWRTFNSYRMFLLHLEQTRGSTRYLFLDFLSYYSILFPLFVFTGTSIEHWGQCST
ncbi:reverse transcriptase domain-containing protein [Tanacetum coccineum]